MSRPQVALFTELLDFDDSYSDLLWRAADSRARERDVDLVVCVGHRIGRAEPDDPAHNRLFRVALDRKWDGIVLAHIVYQHLDFEDRAALARRLEGLPVVVSSVPLGDAPMVGFENGSGMAELLGHLLEVHGKRRLLFVSGPLDVEDAVVRHRVWVDTMRSAGLPHGPEWLVEGDFNPLFCPAIVDEVAGKVRLLDADAVVTSSDLVAEALIRGLPTRGIRVPQDVSVTGFDDIPLAGQIDPALTTVRQPILDQFRKAVDLALDGVCVEAPPARGTLVVRTSCGCSDKADEESDARTWKRRVLEAREQTRNLRSRVANLNLFASHLDSLQGAGALEALFEEWMPRLGIDGYALSLACQADGSLRPWAGADPFASGDSGFLRWAGSQPPLAADQALVFPSTQMAPAAWWAHPVRRTMVALPLVVVGVWYGLVLLEVGPEGNLMCRAVQELTASFLDREYRLKEEVRQAMEARISTELEAEKNRTLGILVAGFSHDLATPFSVGQDSIQLLAEGFGGVRQELAAGTLAKGRLQGFLDQGATLTQLLGSSWGRATDLVERFKRIGTEVPRDDLRRVFLHPFLSDLLQSLRPLWRHRQVSVELEVDPGLEVQTRVSALVDILTNLIQNALVHAFPHGREGKVLVRALGLDQRCRLEFQDDGVGVDPGVADRIFDPYVTTKEGEGGTGLGLAVVRQRTQGLLGGTVICEAVPGGGTRFVLDFPRILTE